MSSIRGHNFFFRMVDANANKLCSAYYHHTMLFSDKFIKKTFCLFKKKTKSLNSYFSSILPPYTLECFKSQNNGMFEYKNRMSVSFTASEIVGKIECSLSLKNVSYTIWMNSRSKRINIVFTSKWNGRHRY